MFERYPEYQEMSMDMAKKENPNQMNITEKLRLRINVPS